MAMKAEEAYALSKSYVKKSLEGQGALKGEDGVSPVISVNTSTADTYKLDITDKNGTITTPNLVGKQGLQGIQGEQGRPADNPIVTENADNTEDVYKLDLTVGETVFTTKNIIGKQGLEGVSPSVTTNPDNTAEDYRLNITTKGGTFTTPNLRGPKGEQGPQGESAASAINPRGDYDVNADPHYTLSDYITSAEGNTYVCKKDNPDNVAPTDGTINDEFWQVLALRGAKGESGKDGEKGADGVTFTPSIDANGVLSFTNNGGLENPEPIDIKGDNGITFTPSIDAEGYLSFTNNGNLENPEPIKVLGKDGVDGKDGADGTTYIPSIGTVTTVENNADASAGVTVDEETKEAVFHFELPKGEKGFSPIVETVESENGHTVNITDVDGVKSFDVFNGKDGVQIDDETTSTDTVWSSKKTSDEIAEKVDKTDITTTIDSTSTDTQVPSAKSVNDKYEEANVYKGKYVGDLNNIPFIKSGVVYKYDIRSGNCTNTPVGTHGILYSTYFDSDNYCLQEFHSLQTNKASIYRRDKGTGVWSDWQRVCTTSVADVPMTTVSLDSSKFSSGSLRYEVKNGVCYVYITNLNTEATFKDDSMNSILMPMPSSGLVASPIVSETTGATVGLFYINSDYFGLMPRCRIFTSPPHKGYTTFSYLVAES